MARISTAREGGEQYCQLGNSALARKKIVYWLSRFDPDLRSARAVPVMRSTKLVALRRDGLVYGDVQATVASFRSNFAASGLRRSIRRRSIGEEE
jgi:hypothetical protein